MTKREGKTAKKEKKKSYHRGRHDAKPTFEEAIAQGWLPVQFRRLKVGSIKNPNPLYLDMKNPDTQVHTAYSVEKNRSSDGISQKMLQELQKAHPQVFERASREGVSLPSSIELQPVTSTATTAIATLKDMVVKSRVDRAKNRICSRCDCSGKMGTCAQSAGWHCSKCCAEKHNGCVLTIG